MGKFCTRDCLAPIFVRLPESFLLYCVALDQAERVSALCDVSVMCKVLADIINGVVLVEVPGVVCEVAGGGGGLMMVEVTFGFLLAVTPGSLTGSGKCGISAGIFCCNCNRAFGTGIKESVLSFKILVPALLGIC